MFTQELLQELIAYHSPREQVLSLYLDTNSAQQPIETIKLQAKGLLKDLNSGYDQDAKVIEQYLNLNHDWSSPGLAIFSAAADDFFRAYPVAVPFRNRLRVGHKPYLKPLAHFLDYYAHYGVILIDRMGAKFFSYHLGELIGSDGYMGEDVRKLKKGSGSSAVGMRGGQGGGRREEEAVMRNLRDAAAAANDFFANRATRRIFLGGSAETVSQFRDMLPKQLQSCVGGTFTIDMSAGEHEVREHALRLLHEANHVREKKLVKELIALHARGGNAAVGLDDTLQAICDKRVQILVLSDGFRVPGYMHEESGFVVANLAKSPLSEEQLTAVPDVIDTAVTFALAQGGRIEVLSENVALEEAGHIGAILRY